MIEREGKRIACEAFNLLLALGLEISMESIENFWPEEARQLGKGRLL